MHRKRGLAALCAVLVLAACLAGWPVAAQQTQTAPARVIALVYDDSGSMIFNGAGDYQENWYRAKYAMEVFAAMMGGGDTMTVFPMSFYRTSAQGSSPPITLRGSQSADERVQTLHTMNHDYMGTPFHAVEAACQYLAGADPAAQRWLVVLTDGAFEGAPAAGAEDYFRKQAAAGGFQVVYLGMGASAAAVAEDPAAGLYSYRAADSQGILAGVTQVANQVFSRRALPADRIRTEGDELVLDLDLPVSELILFAQGEQVAVGSLTDGTGTSSWTAREKTRVQYSDLVPPNYDDAAHRAKIFFDESLQGMLADFVPDEPLQAGEYRVRVENADTVEVYYTPYVEAALWLTDRTGAVVPLGSGTEGLYSGEYTVELCLIDPLTGEKVSSDLVQLLSAQVEMENNGVQLDLSGLENGSLVLRLERGEVTGSVDAMLDGYQSARTEFSGQVAPGLWEAALQVALPETGESGCQYISRKLTGGIPVQVTVEETDPDSGQAQPMTEADWQNAAFTVQAEKKDDGGMVWWKKPLYWLYRLLCCPGGTALDWRAVPGQETSTFLVSPAAPEEATPDWGSFELTLTMESAGQDHSSRARAVCVVTVAPPGLGEIAGGLAPFGGGLGVLLVVLVLWLRKKRLPRGLAATLHVHRYSVGSLAGGDMDFPVSVHRRFSLFRPETATVSFSVGGVLSAPVLELRAAVRTGENRRRRFYITNIQRLTKEKSIQPVVLNNFPIQEGDEKKLQGSTCLLECNANRDNSAGKHARCTLQFCIRRKRGGLLSALRKKRRRPRRRRR